MIYPDTSFLLALYVRQEPYTSRASALMQRRQEPLAFTPLHRHELRNAIRLCTFRKEITSVQRRAALGEMETDLHDNILIHTPLPWTDMLKEAEKISEQYTETIGTRALDLMHVASACSCKLQHFITFDKRQAVLAKHIGLQPVHV